MSNFTFLMLNVGEGNAYLVIKDECFWIFGFGSFMLPSCVSSFGFVSQESVSVEMLLTIILKQLNSKKCNLVLSCPSEDYCSFADLLLRKGKNIQWTVYYDSYFPFSDYFCQHDHDNVVLCALSGEECLNWDGTSYFGNGNPPIQLLNCKTRPKFHDRNANSLVFKICYDNLSILLMANSTSTTYKYINPQSLKSKILQVSNDPSLKDSVILNKIQGEDFLNWVQPMTAIISTSLNSLSPSKVIVNKLGEYFYKLGIIHNSHGLFLNNICLPTEILTFDSTKDFDIPVASLRLKDSLSTAYLTHVPIYTTASSGTIKISSANELQLTFYDYVNHETIWKLEEAKNFISKLESFVYWTNSNSILAVFVKLEYLKESMFNNKNLQTVAIDVASNFAKKSQQLFKLYPRNQKLIFDKLGENKQELNEEIVKSDENEIEKIIKNRMIVFSNSLNKF